MNKTLLITFITAAFVLAGCDNKPAPSEPIDAFYHQKNSAVYTYEQNEQKFAYEACLAKHRESHTEGECHVPDFLKK
jgi:hypothetical protein